MIIYKITNQINGKIYIGQTSRSLDKRWWEHRKDAENSELPLYRAIRKYGIDNFSIEEIDSANNITELNYLESHYIYKYESLATQNGYNSMTGGRNSKHSVDTKEKISNIIRDMDKKGLRPYLSGKNNPAYGKKYRKGSSHTEESKIKMSKSHTGNKLSKETRQKMSNAHKKRMENPELRKQISEKLKKNSTLKKPIVRSDGVIFESLHECARQMNTTAPCISRVLSGTRKTHKGYSFEYLESK